MAGRLFRIRKNVQMLSISRLSEEVGPHFRDLSTLYLYHAQQCDQKSHPQKRTLCQWRNNRHDPGSIFPSAVSNLLETNLCYPAYGNFR